MLRNQTSWSIAQAFYGFGLATMKNSFHRLVAYIKRAVKGQLYEVRKMRISLSDVVHQKLVDMRAFKFDLNVL